MKEFSIEDEIHGCSIDILIKYLHHLQNLFFALTGKELEIKL